MPITPTYISIALEGVIGIHSPCAVRDTSKQSWSHSEKDYATFQSNRQCMLLYNV